MGTEDVTKETVNQICQKSAGLPKSDKAPQVSRLLSMECRSIGPQTMGGIGEPEQQIAPKISLLIVM